MDDRPLVVDTRKAVAILAMLAAEARPFARDELAALLWPDSDDTAARGALRRTLSTLRSAIGDGPLVIERTLVDLDRRRVWVDLWAVEAAAGASDRATLQAAATLGRGTFLAGFNLRDSLEFDDWRAGRAVAAERSMLAVLDRLAIVAAAEGDLPAAIDAASRRLDLDPLDEGSHVRLMDLLVAGGDRSAALRQYRACVATLERELGVPPLATTTARYEAIRDGTADRAPEAIALDGATDVPAHDAHGFPLVGRAAALATLTEAAALAELGRGSIVAVVGEAGIGKSRIAAEAARSVFLRGGIALMATAYPAERAIAYGSIVELLRVAQDLPDASARWARMPSAIRGELARLLPSIDDRPVSALPADGAGAHARLVGAIADGLTSLVAGPRPGLIWVDDVQWLDGASREALDFMIRRLEGHAVVLGLSWRPEDLDTDGLAFAQRVRTLGFARTVELERFGRDDVGALVGSAGRGAEADAIAVDDLLDASEGLPLYVVEVLASGGRLAPGSLPNGVRAVLRERLGSVGETTTQVLAAASVIGRSFDLPMVRHASGRSEEETVDALDEALRRGLIREAPAGFDFVHAAVRDLSYEATSATRRRLLHRRAAEAHRLDLAGSGRDDLGRLVLVATHERAAGRDEAAAEAYLAAGRRAAALYANRDAIDLFGAALALGHHDVAELHAGIGRLWTRLGEYAGAIAAYEAAASVASPEDVPALEWELARAHLRRGDLGAAAHHLDAAESGARDDALLARVWVDRSVMHRRSRDAAAAAIAAREALVVAERANDPVGAGAAHRMLGLAALDAGDPSGATTELKIALDASATDPDPTARIATLAGLAIATASDGSLDDALGYGEDALAACRLIGDRHLEAAVEDHLADILHAVGRDADAMPHQRRAAEAFAEVGGDRADPDPGIWMLSAS